MRFARSGEYMLAGDDGGRVFYWTPNMSCEVTIQAHGGAAAVVAISIASVMSAQSQL
jgi:hypothetical protein